MSYPPGVAIDRNENVYIADAGSSRVRHANPGGTTTFAGTR
ncbi:hypothetical protein [Frankia sp. R43]